VQHPTPDESNDQHQMDIYDQNKVNETHQEVGIQNVGTDGPTQPQENANPAEDQVVIQPSNFEQEIIDEDNPNPNPNPNQRKKVQK